MDKLEKKFKSYIAMTSGMTITMVILGMIFLFMPGASLDIIRWIITACLIAAGLYSLMTFASFIGVIILVLGAIVALNPGVVNIIPVIFGSYVLFSSVIKLIGLQGLKTSSFASFVITMGLSVIGVICGAVMIAHPDATNVVAMRIIGTMMLIYGVSDFIDVLIMRRHVAAFSKTFKSKASTSKKEKKGTRIDDIQEAKIVKKKH